MILRFLLVGLLVFSFFNGCVSVVKKKPDFYDIEVNEFSFSIKSLLSDSNFLKDEILKINAKRPSIQRILTEADSFWLNGDATRANLELERALRISKDESALYLRLAHIRLEQGLIKESKAFASRGLLNEGVSVWEALLLNVYSKIK